MTASWINAIRNAHRWTLALICLASCSGALNGGGQTGKGGTVATGQGGAVGTGEGGAVGTGGTGATGGAALQCPIPPPTDDPACHPDDGHLHSINDTVVVPESGDCRAGLRCDFWVGVSTGCDQAGGPVPFICCPSVFAPASPASPYPVFGSPVPTLHGGFVPGSALDACPTPIAGQDAACALPLAGTCPVDGLRCTFESISSPGCDGGCLRRDDTVRCCAGVWIYGDTCPADAGTN